MTKTQKPNNILVLGASGMLGHMLVRVLTPHHNVMGTTSSPYDSTSPLARILERDYWLDLVDVRNWESVVSVINTSTPAVVINCVGVIKQKMDASTTMDTIFINSLIPHKLAQLCDSNKIRFIHFSTDCVFEGTPGLKYVSDTPNATDLYGTTKHLGEVTYGQSLTLRTSIVGRQLSGSEGLFEWVRSQKGRAVNCFKNAIYSGLTTMALSEVVRKIIEDHPTLAGLHQVASVPIDKFTLITKLNDRLNLGLAIAADTKFKCDRSLDGTIFNSITGIHIPSWDDMLDEFAADQEFYHFN